MLPRLEHLDHVVMLEPLQRTKLALKADLTLGVDDVHELEGTAWAVASAHLEDHTHTARS